MKGVARKSSRQDPGETRDWPPPSAPAAVCWNGQRVAVSWSPGRQQALLLQPWAPVPWFSPHVRSINQTLCFGSLSPPQGQECPLQAPNCPPSPQFLGLWLHTSQLLSDCWCPPSPPSMLVPLADFHWQRNLRKAELRKIQWDSECSSQNPLLQAHDGVFQRRERAWNSLPGG